MGYGLLPPLPLSLVLVGVKLFAACELTIFAMKSLLGEFAAKLSRRACVAHWKRDWIVLFR